VSFYLDANVLVALFVTDALTKTADAWIDSDPGDLVVSDFAKIEVAAVVSRQVRVGSMTLDAAREALVDFDVWVRRMASAVETSASDLALAERFVRDFATKLSAPDALHLAVTLNHGFQLVTFDARLADAARLLGSSVITPS